MRSFHTVPLETFRKPSPLENALLTFLKISIKNNTIFQQTIQNRCGVNRQQHLQKPTPQTTKVLRDYGSPVNWRIPLIHLIIFFFTSKIKKLKN